MTYQTREEWLTAAIEIFRPRFAQLGYALPERIRISVGWTKGARPENGVILGTTFSKACAADEINEIFITPEDADPASMITTVLHELIHVYDNCQHGHRGVFIEIAKALGFEAPMTETPAGPVLAAEMITIAESLGAYPGARVTPPSKMPVPVGTSTGTTGGGYTSSGGPQTNRQRLTQCTEGGCTAYGYRARTTKTWLDSHGAPICPGSMDRTMKPHRLTVM